MGAAVAVTRDEFTPPQLRAAARASEDPAQVRRLLAVALVLEGVSRQQAAEQCGMDRQTLRDWVHRYNEGGVASLQSRPSPGRTPLLTPEQKAELKALVVAGPDPERDQVVRWRCVDLRAEVARRFGVEVREGTIGGWLHGLGLTRLQPRPHHPKKDAAAQEAYKKALFDLGVGWPRQTYFELRQRPIQRWQHDVVSPVRFGRTPHPSRTALTAIAGA